jgi:fluoride ion exporter CrcB/FEX
MVSWERAFGTAVKIVLLTIVWCILGAAISIMLIVMVGNVTTLSTLSNPTMLLNPANFIASFIAWLVGAIVGGLGALTTYLKYSAELYAGKVKARKDPALSFNTTTSTRNVGAPSASRQPIMFCQTCGTQNSTSSKYCKKCGNRFPTQ